MEWLLILGGLGVFGVLAVFVISRVAKWRRHYKGGPPPWNEQGIPTDWDTGDFD